MKKRVNLQSNNLYPFRNGLSNTKKSRILVNGLMFCILCLVLTNCTKESIVTDELTEQSITDSNTLNSFNGNQNGVFNCNARKRFAKTLSKTLNDEATQDFLIQETRKKENGDYVFLYALSKSKKERSGKPFQDVLTDSDEIKNDNFYKNKVLKDDPLLSVYLFVPSNISLDKVTAVNKVYCDCEIDDMDKSAKIEYYVDGKKFKVDAIIEPTEPVIVIKTNERVSIDDGTSNFTNNYNEAKELGAINEKKYFLTLKIIDSNNLLRTPEDGAKSRGCQRDIYKQQEGLGHFYFTDDLEGWFKGGPELVVNVMHYLNGNATVLPNEYGYSDGDKQKWLYVGGQYLTWRKENFGQQMIYHLSEKDGGSNDRKWKLSLTVKVGDVSATVSGEFGNDKDDLYGSSYVDYCEWVSPTSWGTHHTAGQHGRFYVNVN